MKQKFSLIVLLCLAVVFQTATAQGKKKKKETYQPPVVVEDAVVDLMVVAEEGPSYNSVSNSSMFEPIKNIRYNDKYEVYDGINDKYDFFCEKNSKNRSSNLGIVDKNGNVILPCFFSKSYNSSTKTEVMLYMNNNYGLFNLIDLRWSVPMQYEDMNNLGNGLFTAKKNGKWGVIDNNNTIIVSFDWDQIYSVSNLDNYVVVTSTTYPNKLKGVYSLVEHKLTIPCDYTSVEKLDKQNSFLVNNGTQYNIVDINNTPRFKQWYDMIKVPSSGRLNYIVKANNLYGIIDDNEKTIVPLVYTEFASYPYSDGSYLARNKEGKYGFMLIDGRVTLPFEYDNLTRKYDDNVVSVRNGKCGLVQVNSGVPYEIVTCDYDDIKGGRKTFVVEKAGKFGLLDIYGKPLTDINYTTIVALDENSSDNIIYKAVRNDSVILINEQGKAITDNQYTDFSVIIKSNTSSYYYGSRYSYFKGKHKNGKYAIIDKVGKSISKPLFDDIQVENDNLFIVKSNNKYGMYAILTQKLIVDYQYDLIIKTNDNYFGFSGRKIDLLYINSGQVNKVPTIK